MRRNLTTKPAGNTATKIDWTHPLTRGLVAAWVFAEDSDSLVPQATKGSYFDLVHNVKLTFMCTMGVGDLRFGGVPFTTGMGAMFSGGGAFNGSNDRLQSANNPHPELQQAKELSFFWRGSIWANENSSGNPPIAEMMYANTGDPNTNFRSWGVVRNQGANTDLQWEYTTTGPTFNFLTSTGVIPSSSYGKPLTLGMSRSADGPFTKTYINGIPGASDTVAGNLAYGLSPFLCLNGNPLIAGGTCGTFADVLYVWKRALSAFEQAWLTQHPYEILFTPFVGRPFTMLIAHNFSQTFTAGMATMGATLPKQTNHVIAAAMSTFAATLAKRTAMTLTAAMSTFAGALTKQTDKVLNAAMSTWSATLTTLRTAFGTFNASMATFSGVLVKQTNRTLNASMSTFAGMLTKLTSRTLNAAMATFAGALGAIRTFVIAFTAAMSTFAAVLTRVQGRALGAAMSTFSGALTAIKIPAGKAETFTAGMATFDGALVLQGGKVFGASMNTFSATLALAVTHGGVPSVCTPVGCNEIPPIISHVEQCENPGS